MKVTRRSRFGWAWTSQPVRGSNGRLEVPRPTRPHLMGLTWRELEGEARSAARSNNSNDWSHSVFVEGKRLKIRVFDLLNKLELDGWAEVDFG